MALQAWQMMLSVIGGAYKERWPDDELRIIFLTTLFAGVVSAACCLLPALPAACCLLLAARCMLPTALLADASHSAIPRSLAAHYPLPVCHDCVHRVLSADRPPTSLRCTPFAVCARCMHGSRARVHAHMRREHARWPNLA